MSALLPYIVIGLVSGALYGLVAVGLVLTYQVSGIFNFGHGAVAAASAFVFYSLWTDHGVPWPLAGLLTVAGFSILGGLLLDLVATALAGAAEVVTVVVTVGLLVGVQGALYLIYGNSTHFAPFFLPESGFHLAGVLITWAQVISCGVAVVGAVGLHLYLRYARLGVAMRGVVDNPRLLVLGGDDAARIRRFGWMIGAGLAAVSGILLAPLLNLEPQVLSFLIVQAFGACAIGRFKSLLATFGGGLVVGVSAALITKFATRPSLSGLPIAAPFIVLLVVLLVVPARHFPRVQRSRAALASRAVVSVRTRAIVAAVAGVVVLALPFLVGTRLPVWTSGVVSVLVFSSLSFLTWGSGQISLCHASFLALGATTMSHLTQHGVPWGVALPIAGLAVVPLGALVALPAVRLSGIYLALATLGLGMFLQSVVFQSSLMFGHQLTATINRPVLGAFDANSGRTYYFLALGVVSVCVAILLACQRGRFGRFLASLAESPSMLSTNGLGLNTTRLLVFCLSALFAGVAGALATTLTTASNAITFSAVQSLMLVAVLGICGTRRLVAPVAAALLFSVLPGYASAFGLNQAQFAFGTVAVLGGIVLGRRQEIEARFRASTSRTAERRRHGPLAVPRRVVSPISEAGPEVAA